MAAHILTATRQTIETLESGNPTMVRATVDGIRAALNLSSWTEDLDLDSYRNLARAVSAWDVDPTEDNRQMLVMTLGVIQGLYTTEWLKLDRPRTREEWRERKWGSA
jgi:hypothetical protein